MVKQKKCIYGVICFWFIKEKEKEMREDEKWDDREVRREGERGNLFLIYKQKGK